MSHKETPNFTLKDEEAETLSGGAHILLVRPQKVQLEQGQLLQGRREEGQQEVQGGL